MEKDIVERLRDYNGCTDDDIDEAADIIERMRTALVTISLMDKKYEHDLFSATRVAQVALGGE